MMQNDEWRELAWESLLNVGQKLTSDKDEHPLNRSIIFVTLEELKFEKSMYVIKEQLANMQLIFVIASLKE